MRAEAGELGPSLTYAAIQSRLTSRQREILECFVAEPNEARVAKRLGLATRTVRNQIPKIMHRLHISCRVELANLVLLAKLEEGGHKGPPDLAGQNDRMKWQE